MLGSSRGLESGSTKRGEIHHIAIVHGPMVQGGLLTTHPGGVHGYGWSPGGGSSFQQGAGAASPGSPDLETAGAVQRRVRRKEIDIRGFHPRAKYRRRGHRGDPQGSQEGARRGPGWGRARDPSGVPGVAPSAALVIPEASVSPIFYLIFPEFLEHFLW